MHAFSGSEEEVLSAMAEHRNGLEQLWGQNFPALVSYVARATGSWKQHLDALRRNITKDAPRPTLIIVGERGSSHEPVHAATAAAELMAPHVPHWDILFTGGVYGLAASHGEVPAATLASWFHNDTGHQFGSRASVDQFSKNTGHQGRIIGQIVRTIGYDWIIVCLPIEHIARFAATLAFDLHQHGYHRPFTFLGTGNWGDVIPERDMTRAREAFGPIQSPEEAKLSTKRLGGEYAARLHTECFSPKRFDFACPALPPSDMLASYMSG